MKKLIKAAAYHLDDDVLAVHLQLMVMSIAKVLVALYVIGQMASEYMTPVFAITRTALTRLSEQFVYKVTPLGDDASIQLNETN